MTAGATFTIKGLDHLLKMTNADILLGPPLRTALEKSAIEVENRAKELSPVDRGRLRAAITHRLDTSPLPRWAETGVIGGGGTLGAYAATMEYGRRAGARMPPVDAIAEWLRRHGSSASPFVVARNIGRRGIREKRYLRGGLDASISAINGHMATAARDIETLWRNTA